MNEDQFLKASSILGVDRVRHGDARDVGTVYVYVGFEHKQRHAEIVSLAERVWPRRRIIVLNTVPTKPPEK